MLKAASQAQRHLSEEDSSGSDAGSEVSLEPETDRFGFILTNGSTTGSVGPSPELVRQREAKWITIISQWDRILLKKSSKVKLQCQKGIPASLRAKCWPLLCGATDRMKQNENLYKSLDSQPGLQSWVEIIERDLDRQFPFHEMFLSKDGHGQQGLFRVLKAYTQFQPEEGYCQAQGPVAAVLLMNMPAEEAFWCLVQISEQYLPGYYSPLLEGVLFDAALLSWVLKKTCPAAHKHLQQHGVEPLMFATDWLMCLFTRHLPFNTLLRVWDLFFCYGVKVLLQVAVVLVRRVLGRAEQRKQCPGQMETLERLRGVREHVQEEEESFIAEVFSVPLSRKDLEKRTEKELGRWRKDKPSSTFDPRGRCYGYRMAWARARHEKDERDRKERETCNLSVPLTRSVSTLSLSPSLLQKRFRKGGKAPAGEWERGNKVSRHLSMGAREDWKSWSDVDFRKVQGVQEEDVVSDGQTTESEIKVEEETEREENKNSLIEHKEETVRAEEQTEPLAAGISEKEESKEIGESTEGSQSGENNSQTAEEYDHCEEKEKLENPNQPQAPEEQSEAGDARESENQKDLQTVSQPYVLEEQCNKNNKEESEETENTEKLQNADQSHVQEEQSDEQESEVTDVHKEAENPAAENKNTTITEENHTETQRENTDTNTETQPQIHIKPWEESAGLKPEAETQTEDSDQSKRLQLDSETSETRSETNLDSESHRDPDPKTETQQEHEEVITETQEKCRSTESFSETEQAEFHAQTESETDVLAETAAVQDEINVEKTQTVEQTEEDSQIPSAPESTIQDNEAEIKTVVKNEFEAVTNQIVAPVHAETENQERASNQNNSEGLQIHNETSEEDAECASPPTEQEILTHDAPVNLKEKTDQTEITTSEMKTSGSEAENKENVPESKAGEDNALISPETTNVVNTNSNIEIQDKPHQDTKDLPEPSESSQEQTSTRRSSRSSGDFRLRKSSGSKVTRRLSEDLFSCPERTNQPLLDTSQPNSGPEEEEKPEQNLPEVTDDAGQPPPDTSKRFGLFRKLKGEQPKKDKPKKKPKMQVPKILIQDFSDVTPADKPVRENADEKLSSRERRRQRREQERKEKEEGKLKKKKEKEQERERRKPQTRGKSFQVQKEKISDNVAHPAKAGSEITRHSASYAESYF